jgi:hypothetical protein
VSMPTETPKRDMDKLWVSDSEIIRRLGVSEKKAREAIRMAEAKANFPRKQKLWGDKRYWPAVRAYFDNLYGGNVPQRRDRA